MKALRNAAWIFAILFSFLPVVHGAQSAPEVLRVLILDKSASMQGARIEQVKRTVREWVENYPSAPDSPFAIIPFDRKAGGVRVFTDNVALERFLKDLDAGGSTSIASGLRAGATFIRDYRDASNLVLLLVTDGEDTVDPQAVPAAEAELDAIFSRRGVDRLPTSVFVQRWDDVNDELVRRWLGKPDVKVYDLGSKKPVTLAITPRVHIQQLTWASDKAQRLQASVAVGFDIAGRLPTGQPLEVEVETSAKGVAVAGEMTAVIPRGGGVIALELIPDGEPEQIELMFSLRVLTHETSNGPLLATFSRPILITSVAVPRIPLSLTTTLEPHGSRWISPGCAVADVSLHVVSLQPHAGISTAPLQLTVDFGSATVLSGAEVVRLSAEGHVTEIYALEQTQPATEAEFLVTARVSPKTLPWPLQLDSASRLSASTVVSAPAPSQAFLHAEARITRAPLWTDLATAQATLEADLVVTADSSADGVELVADATAPALVGRAPRAILRGGRAAIPLRLRAEMHPGTTAAFELRVSPAAGVPLGLTIEPVTIRIEVDPPAPATLRLTFESSESARQLALPLLRTPWLGEVRVTPTLFGPIDEGSGTDLAFAVGTPASAAGTKLEVGKRASLAVTVPHADQPFFDDRSYLIEIGVVLPRGVHCVVFEPSHLRVTLVGAHKKTLLAGTAFLTLLVAVSLGIRIYTQSSSSSERAKVELS